MRTLGLLLALTAPSWCAGGRSSRSGLVDAHVQLTISGDPGENAAATLRAGFTSVVDLGSADGAGAPLRDSIAAGRLLGPRVIAAGSRIGSKGGVREFGGATVAGVTEARARAELEAGMLAAVREVGDAAGRPVYARAMGRAGALLAAAGSVRAPAHTPIVDSAEAARLGAARIPVISTLTTLTAPRERSPGTPPRCSRLPASVPALVIEAGRVVDR